MKIEFFETLRGTLHWVPSQGVYVHCIDLYFVKDGKEHFVAGQLACDDPEYKIEGLFEEMKSQVIKNEGKFVTFKCAEWYYPNTQGCRDPIKFLNWVEKQNFSFEIISKVWRQKELLGKPWFFLGNLREASAAFSFRIWDESIAEEVIRRFNQLRVKKGPYKN